MGDFIIFLFFHNIFIFCCIFWLLTFLGEYFYTDDFYEFKNQFYECGFQAVNEINLQINFNFIIFASFLILYDVEFMLAVPFIFNINYITQDSVLIFLIFLIFFLCSFFYDWYLRSLNTYL